MNTQPTPVMEQYLAIKEQHLECLLFYRMGDFYELFFDDAIQAAKILNIALTKRGKHSEQDIPMCGVPAHSSIPYLHKLVKNGFKVAICEQLETPTQAKKRGYKAVINREVVRIITPGTIFEDELLNSNQANYILAIVEKKNEIALSWLDISTGVFFYCSSHNLNSDIARIEPKEILIAESVFDNNQDLQRTIDQYGIFITKYSDSFFEYKKTEKRLCDFYSTSFTSNIGEISKLEVSACGAILEYVWQTQKSSLHKLGYPKLYNHKHFLHIDAATRNSLELTSTQLKEHKGSLVSVIDYTVTSGGSRLLKGYISAPLTDANTINKRLDLVESYTHNQHLRQEIREILKHFPDIERSLSRISVNRAKPQDLHIIKNGLQIAMQLSCIIYKSENTTYKNLEGYSHLIEVLNNALNAECVHNKNGFINPDFSPKLAELEYIRSNSSILINDLQDIYRKRTGIAKLKIASNNLIGYYIEASAQYQITDTDFIHKQSLVNCVRYTTNSLQDLANKIVTANANFISLEQEIFENLCTQILEHFTNIMLTAHTVARLDVISSLAELAVQHNYTKPIVDDSNIMIIKGGLHPVVSHNVDNFIANDIKLNEKQKICLLTGPNMAGKSTFLRQNALIAIMAHIGSFVPAQSAHIGTIDKIFSRVGAADNISKGQSTFMVEMMETAAIVNQATHKSLVILDEVGRGTALYDGLSIAWAVIENIHNINQCRAIFATHYHELCQLQSSLSALSCYSMKVKEWNKEIIFLHEVIEGKSNKSYGIHVAKLAGLPQPLIKRAEAVLEKLEN